MAKVKDRDMYRLTVPGATVRAISKHYPHLISKEGAIDDVAAVNTVLNEWLRSVADSKSKSLEEVQKSRLDVSKGDDLESDKYDDEPDDLPPIH